MQRRGLKLPLLIGGATTSRQHTAVRVAPAYDGTTIHVLDASRVAGVVGNLLDPDRAEALAVSNSAEQERLREQHATRQHQPLLTLEQARANREQVPFDDLPVPDFTGIRTVCPDLAALREMIDWQFLFLAWELKGKYPAILDQPVARELYDEANTLLDQIISGGQFRPRGAYGFWQARAAGDDILIDADPYGTAADGGIRLPMLRQQTAKPAGRPNRSLADYLAPAGDHIGGFAVAIHGAEELAADLRSPARRLPGDHGEGPRRPACRGVRRIHSPEARRAWFEPDADPKVEDLHAERFRGIRPALGYPASPDHSQKQVLFDLLEAKQLDMALTESFAMTPAASVSGLLFAHPASRYFTVGRIGQDQAADYALRRGLSLAEVERWLRPNLAYDPQPAPDRPASPAP